MFRVRGSGMRWVISSLVGFVVIVTLSASGARAVAAQDDLPEGEGKKIEWNAEKLEATNAPEVANVVHRNYREEWVAGIKAATIPL